jgi:RHS repeat-associated protein
MARFAASFALLCHLTLALTLSLPSFAQVADPVLAAEAPVAGAGHHYIGRGAETVNPADGSLSFDLPFNPPAGRQLSVKFGIRFSGTEQYYLSNRYTYTGSLQWTPNWTTGHAPWQLGAWSYDLPIATATATIQVNETVPDNGCPNGVCDYHQQICWGNDSYVFRGLDGVQTSLAVGTMFPDLNNTIANFCAPTTGRQKTPGNRHGVLATFQDSTVGPPVTVVDQSGTTYQFSGVGGGEPSSPLYTPNMAGALATSITDRNGNQVTLSGNSYKDSTGRTAVSWTGIGNSGDQITVSGLGGPITLNWTTTPVTFNETGYNAYGTCTMQGGTDSAKVINEIDLPNGTKYTFQYDGTYGKISKITFPDGGYVRYVWGLNRSAKLTHAGWVVGGPPSTNYSCDFIFDVPAITDRYVSFDGSTEVLHQQFLYTTNWSGNSWTSKQTTLTSTDLLTSQVTKTIYTYAPQQGDQNVFVTTSWYLNLIPVESSVVHQDGSGKTYKAVNKSWASPHVMLGEQSILYDNVGTAKVGSAARRCYDANEQVTNVYEYGFQTEGSYPGDPSCSTGGLNSSYLGPLRRQTATSYHPFFQWTANPPTATGTHIVNAPDSVTVADGSGATAKQSLYTYDQSSLQPSGAINLSNPGSTRANITTLQRLISGSTYAKTTYSYYDTGQLYTMTDACGSTTCSDVTGTNHTTTYSYADSYASGTGTPPGQTFAYLTQVTHPNTGVAHIDNSAWGYNDGLIRSHTDQNSLTTSYAYADPLTRLTQINNPDGGQTTVSYSDTAPAPTVTTTKKINSTQSVTSVSVSDGLGHVTQTQLTSDPQGAAYSDTTYDGLGRVWKQSNPYRAGTDPTSSPGTTVYAYDAIGRKISETYPDNSVLTTAYCGASTLVTDPTAHWRRSRTDGLGLLVEIDEPNAIGASVASSGCPGTGEPIWVTSYGYDTLGNLLSVLQNSSHSRSFTYDSLSRMLTSANPEVGQITYTYDANSNVNTKKDARNITVTYGYDVLNRPLSRSYSNGDPTVSITYDQTACLSLSACQNIGYRTSMTDAAGSEKWAYQVDSANLKSVHREQRTTNSVTKTSTYYLDLAGNLTEIIYPTGRTVLYTYNNANRPITATDSANGITYATAPTSPLTGCPSSAVCYTPQGSTYSMSIGQTSTFTGLNVQESFNTRLQPSEIKASSSAGNALDITYNFLDALGHNAGHVYGVNNVLNSSRSQSFAYDQLNRIISAGTTATTGTYCWGYQYSYDAWGNLLQQAAWTPNYNACSETTMGGVTADNGNHITGLSYDTSGNTLGDGDYTYTWDGESEMKTAAGVTYTYDGDGRRVKKSSGKLYWYGSGGEILAETNSSGTVTAEYVFFGGKRVAMLPAGANAQYYVEDSLGSSRVVTQNNGAVCYDADFAPYGAERTYTNTCTQNAYKFEGKERDSETQNDDFGARYYSWRFGRWLSSDWSAVPVPVPYANLANPQTLNLYSMVADDPESFADLDGHCAVPLAWFCAVEEQVAADEDATRQRVQDSAAAVKVQAAQNQTPRRSDLIAVRSSTTVQSALPFYAIQADIVYTIVDAKTLKPQSNPEGVQLSEKLAPGSEEPRGLFYGKNPVEQSSRLTDGAYIPPSVMETTYALKQQILVGGKAVQIFDFNSGKPTNGRWVNALSVIEGKFFYQGREWQPGNTY